MQAALGSAADKYTVVASWADVFSLAGGRPDLILAERTVLARTDLHTLNALMEPGRWPPLLLVDTPSAGGDGGIGIVQRLNQAVPQHYQIGDLQIDTRRRRAKLGEQWVTLPPIQYRLLLALANRAGEVVDCQELLRAVWGYEAGEAEARELVKVHIRQIRRRLGLDPEKHYYIRSVRGFGYMIASPEDD
jgi:DNA-binding response OmpR family regulator